MLKNLPVTSSSEKNAINHSDWINSFYLFLSHLEGNTFSGALSAATELKEKQFIKSRG